MFRKITDEKWLDPEGVEALINDAYVQGLQDVKDALIEFYIEVNRKTKNRDEALTLLAKFIDRLQMDVDLYKHETLKNKLFETMGFIRSLSSPKKEEKKATAQ